MPNIDKVVVFDIWGDYGFFRRGYTATSPLTYPFPPRTTLAGMIAAILGIERNKYHGLFTMEDSALALQVINPIKKIRFRQNLINTKEGFYLWDINGQGRTQVTFEYLRDPRYRIYAWLKGNQFAKLEGMLKEHKSVYTPYLGISEHIANFGYIGTFNVKSKEAKGEEVDISSIMACRTIEIKQQPGRKYNKVRTPGFMDENRVVKKFLDFIFEDEGKTIKITEGEYHTVDFKEKGESTDVIFF